MNPEEAADLAARTHKQIVAAFILGWGCEEEHLANLERVASDLAGLRDHGTPGLVDGPCRPCYWDEGCPDAARYADGLRRTARLYGVTS